MNVEAKSPMGSGAALLTVVVTTYNHERYIEQALDGVGAQVTRFAFEVVVLDDCSTDRTPAIVRRMAESSPVPMTLVQPPQNNNNLELFASAIDSSGSRYIAILDGDDYWTDEHKLQRQVDFLEDHPDCVLSFHNVLLDHHDDTSPPRPEYAPGQLPTFSDRDDLWRGNFVRTAAVVFRRDRFKSLPSWYKTCPFGDWELFYFLAGFGRLGYLDEPMAAYRIHQQGAWSGRTSRDQAERCLEAMAVMEAHTTAEDVSAEGRYSRNRLRADLYLEIGDWPAATRALWQAARTVPSSSPNRLGRRTRALGQLLHTLPKALL